MGINRVTPLTIDGDHPPRSCSIQVTSTTKFGSIVDGVDVVFVVDVADDLLFVVVVVVVGEEVISLLIDVMISPCFNRSSTLLSSLASQSFSGTKIYTFNRSLSSGMCSSCW